MLTALVFGILGLIVGSFLNVLILRRGEVSLGGRSRCPNCKTTIAWYDNIPVLSWIFLRARCRHCRARISVQYPLVEAGTGILFALIGGAPFFGIGHKVLFCMIAALLVAIAVHDLRTTIIPDPWVYAFAALALIVMAPAYLLNPEMPLYLILLAGPVVALPLYLLWYVSGGRWMGFGDVKLALGIGWLLGLWWGLFAIFFAFIIGGVVSAPLLFFSSNLWKRIARFIQPHSWHTSGAGFTMKSEIPFGPFLIASTLFVWFMHMYGIDIPLTL